MRSELGKEDRQSGIENGATRKGTLFPAVENHAEPLCLSGFTTTRGHGENTLRGNISETLLVA